MEPAIIAAIVVAGAAVLVPVVQWVLPSRRVTLRSSSTDHPRRPQGGLLGEDEYISHSRTTGRGAILIQGTSSLLLAIAVTLVALGLSKPDNIPFREFTIFETIVDLYSEDRWEHWRIESDDELGELVLSIVSREDDGDRIFRDCVFLSSVIALLGADRPIIVMFMGDYGKFRCPPDLTPDYSRRGPRVG